MLPPGIAQATLFTPPCSPSTGVYNPKAFVLHAASLGQAVAHCRRFSTAATRRCLGSVSVPVWRATLARPLGVIGLVGRHPTNDLIPRRPVPRRSRTFGPGGMSPPGVMGDYPQFPVAVPLRGVGCRRLTHPCATPPRGVRLACLIHAANVHSEPGSNPPKSCAPPEGGPPTPRTRFEWSKLAPTPSRRMAPRRALPTMPARAMHPAPATSETRESPRPLRGGRPMRRSVAGPPRGHAGGDGLRTDRRCILAMPSPTAN